MSDEFFTQFREEPRTEFARALYKRISIPPQLRFYISTLGKLTFRNVATGLALMFFIAACAYAVTYSSPYHKIGDIWLTVQKTQRIEYVPIQITSQQPVEQPSLYQCLPREEAEEILRFDFMVPAWAPKGYTFDGKLCGVHAISDFASLSWMSNDGTSHIHLLIKNLKWYDAVANVYRIGSPAALFPVAPGSYSEVRVNNQPAVLIRGDWETQMVFMESADVAEKIEQEIKWDKRLGLQLYWVKGEILYYLQTRSNIPANDLIKMAESAR
jgi:hypothetical protein